MARRAGGGPNEPRRPGRLSHEDQVLWAEVARTAQPLHGQARLRGTTALGPSEGEAPASPHAPAPPRSFRPRGPAEPAVRITHAQAGTQPLARTTPGLDRRTAERVRRGERAPDARIDLHGMTTERAHAALDTFIAGAARAGHRLLLVITGKGRSGGGVLREQVPGWLRAGPHGRRILGVWQAHRRHGGEGALYVYLRKPG